MVREALTDIGFSEEKILNGLNKIYNPGRFEWIAPNILVDTANNRENIKILEKMVRKVSKNKNIVTLFGTTQTDPIYAAELAQAIQSKQRILIDDFSERSLPCSKYQDTAQYSEIIHLKKEVKKIQKYLNKKNSIVIVYGSFYLVGEIMQLSRYKPFAST